MTTPPPRHGARLWQRAAACALRAATLLSCLAVVTLGDAGVAQAHARLLRASPADGQVLGDSPATVELWFNEILDEEFNAVEVVPAGAGAEDAPGLASRPPSVDTQDRTHLVAPLPRLEPGRYVVRWKVLSRDGHPARGRTEFVVRGSGLETP